MGINLEQIKKDLKQFRKLDERKITRRLYVIGGYETAKFKAKFLIKEGVSERTYYRWKKSYIKNGALGLKDKKGRGRKKNYIRGKLASKIKFYRKEYVWGAEVICAHINYGKPYKEHISEYKVNRFLKEKKFITTIKRKKEKKKHNKIVKVKKPGELTQMDVKHLTELHPSITLYAYNFVDHASKWSYKQIFDSYGPYETRQFMETVIRLAPFDILKEQTDNGIEFTNKFVSDPLNPKEHALDKLCKEHGIIHKLIPVGEKEINGLVEKHHHLDYKEFYRKQKTIDLEVLKRRCHKHCLWRNENRRYKSLGWKTPNEWLAEYEKSKKNAKDNNINNEKGVKFAA